MAYEYLDATTDAMFQCNMVTSSISIALAFYENTLKVGKFKSQRYHFQRNLQKWNHYFFIGYFATRKGEVDPGLRHHFIIRGRKNEQFIL